MLKFLISWTSFVLIVCRLSIFIVGSLDLCDCIINHLRTYTNFYF